MILFYDIDAFFSSVEEILHPQLKGKPIAVANTLSPKGVISTASYPARVRGVHSAMPLFKARQACSNCMFVKAHFSDYIKFSQKVVSIMSQFSPFLEEASIDEGYLDISGMGRLFKSPLEYGSQIKQEVKHRTGLNITIGIAITKPVAKISALTVKPNGMIYIPQEKTEEFLSRVPIKFAKGLGRLNQERLKKAGITYIGDIISVPESFLSRIIDKSGMKWTIALKKDMKISRYQRKSIGKSVTLMRNTADKKILLPILSLLSEYISERMREKNYFATHISVEVKYYNFISKVKTTGCYPTNSPNAIFSIAKKLLIPLVNNSIRHLGIRCEGLTKTPPLFMKEKEVNLYNAISGIRKKYGFDAVKFGVSISDSTRYTR